MNPTLQAALDYVDRGWAIFPLHGIASDGSCSCGKAACEDAGKHPKHRRGWKAASKDKAQILEWFDNDEPTNIGVATGEISGITVLDIDIGPNKLGDVTWAELTKDKGEPQTLTAKTGGGGLHFYFKYNSALKTSSNTLGKGVDCRNDGGYVCGVPSRHRSGGVYEWLSDVADLHALADLPSHLSKRVETRGRNKKNDPKNKKYSLEQVSDMLKFVKADDRDLWRKVGIVLGREFNRSDAAWKLYNEWADSWEGQQGRNHESIMRECFYELSMKDGDLSMGTIVKFAIEGGWAPKTGLCPVENFFYNAPGNNFIYRPTGSHWPQESVDATVSPVNDNGLILRASDWLKQHKPVTSMTNDPELDEYTKGFDCREGIPVPSEGAALYNAYREADIELGDARLARPFLDHVFSVFNKPGDADMFLDYMAHRVQKPGEKPRFALLIAGEQGVGKDTAITMCTPALGVWNVSNIEPSAIQMNFNEYEASVLVVISETSNIHEMSKFAFNESTKVLIAGNPDRRIINPKYGQKYSVRMHCGVIMTTNHMLSGIYIPPDDRRYDVIESAKKSEMGLEDPLKRATYFSELWNWFYKDQGDSHVAAFLEERDISDFNAASGQRITVAHRMIVSAGTSGDSWFLDALDDMECDGMFRVDHLWKCVERLTEGDMLRKEFTQKISYACNRAGYYMLNCPSNKENRWKFSGANGKERTSVYYNPDKIPIAEALIRAEKNQFTEEKF